MFVYVASCIQLRKERRVVSGSMVSMVASVGTASHLLAHTHTLRKQQLPHELSVLVSAFPNSNPETLLEWNIYP